MIRVSRRCLPSLCFAWMLGASLVAARGEVLPTRAGGGAGETRQFFQRHCVDCHDASEPSGGLDLTALEPQFATREDCARWTRVFDRLARGEMPPAEAKQPDAAAKQAFLQRLRSDLTAAENVRDAAEGRSAWRRLNRVEYQNTVRDLLRVDLDVKSMLPDDGLASGFDNIDTALEISPVHVEKYLEAADTLLDAAIVKTPRPRTETKRYSFLDDQTVGKSEQIRKLPNAAVFTNETYPPKILRQFRAPSAGRYRFRISAYAFQSEKPLPLMIYAGSQDTRRGKTELTQAFDARPGKPQEFTWIELLDRNDTIRVVTQGPRKAWGDSAETYAGPGLAVEWVEAEGPLVEAWPPASHTRLLGDVDLASATTADLEPLLTRFASGAFRRPLAAGELQPIVELARAKSATGATFEEALRLGLKAVLASPEFLFLKAPAGKLNDYALASRLSYFLWSTMPDETLLELAAAGKLSQPEVSSAQVERMLGDPKASAFTENFTGQWLRLREIRATSPDKRLYPEFDELLEWSMVRETRLFFDDLLRHDRSLLNFVQSDFTMLNSRLAEHYGLYRPAGPGAEASRTPLVETLDFQRVQLPPGSGRGGVLTQASVLKVTANGTNTSPVGRGVFVLDRILGVPVPPPPKNVPAIEPDTRGTTTIREQLAKHRTVALCATCHTKIDPPGSALEEFDVVGGRREKYRALGLDWKVRTPRGDGHKHEYGDGPACETDGVLADGRKFQNADELKQLLLASPAARDQIARNLAEKLLMYATGHELEFRDRPEIERLVATVRAKDYGLRSLVQTVVGSEVFLSK